MSDSPAVILFDSAGNPVLGQKEMTESIPVVIASNHNDISIKNIAANVTRTSVACSLTVVTLIVSNTSRRGAIIYNDSTSSLRVALGSGATTIDFTELVPANTAWVVPFGFTGIITGLWSAEIGSARITEITV